MSKIVKLPLASLVEDFDLYPRNEVDSVHVNNLFDALMAGATLPPIVVDEKTKRIVDGVHRYRMHKKYATIKDINGAYKVDVELRRYKTEAEMFLDAARMNAAHGRRLDRHDQVRVVLRARELGIGDDSIAVALQVQEIQIPKLSARVVLTNTGQEVPSKRGAEHLRGQKLTKKQLEALRSVRSAEVGRLCRELTNLLQNGLVDLKNETVVEQLKAVAKLIRKLVG